MRISFRPHAATPRGAVVLGATQALAYADVVTRLGFRGREGEILVLAAPPLPLKWLAVAGMGDGVPDVSRMRRIGGSIATSLTGVPGGTVTIDLGLGAEAAAQLAYGLRLRAYRPLSKYRSRPDLDALGPGPDSVVVVSADAEQAQARFERLEAVARGVYLARDLVAEPGNHLGPRDLADRAALLSALGVEVEILDPGQAGLPLLAAVGQGSVRPPHLVVLRWNGAGRSSAPLVLVGKGVTFDAGGISIKPAEHMEEMKGDMAGAAAIIGAMAAIAGRRARTNVVGVLAVAENMPSGTALRPGDVIRSFKGLTVEVVDTDAEGRLILADALAWACARLKPRAVLDIATLTGAVGRVLGRHYGGLYANDDSFAARVLDQSVAEGENLWRLPLSAACDEDLKSSIADCRNCGWGPVPDNDDAARFLQKFVDDTVPWAHLDIASVSECPEDEALSPKGPTGFGVRLFDSLAGG